MNLLHDKAFINGEWVSALNHATFEVRNPANNNLVGIVPDMDATDTQKAIETASEAFKTWSITTGNERSTLLRKWYDLINTNIESIIKISTEESGKPSTSAKFEVMYGNTFVEWYSEEAKRILGEIIDSSVPNKKMFVEKQPIGVVGLITPWNAPFSMITRKAAAALAAGCTCIIKPAEDTPLSALAAVHLAHEAGFPRGVINVVTCNRKNAPAVGKLLCESPLVAGISFTGSSVVGKILYQQCASHVKRISLELGGNCPFTVFKSANVDKAVKLGVMAKFVNCGQGCILPNRFLIQEDVYDEFVRKFGEEIKNLKAEMIGPLINITQFKRLCSIVDGAKKEGANVVVGGKPAKEVGELFYEPTLITNVTGDMKIYSEEVFGPVACMVKFKTEKEAISMANDTEKGLASYFFTEDVAQIFRISKLLEAGIIGINDILTIPAEVPFGGIKESGLGKEGSHHGIDDFTYMKYVCVGL